MLGQKEILKITRLAGYPVSESSLRNYIKEELCTGAIDTDKGISTQGRSAFYPFLTAIEAAVAKDMLKKSGRRLENKHVHFARWLGTRFIDGAVRPFDIDDLFKAIDEYRLLMESRRVNAKVDFNSEFALNLAYEWLFKFCKLYFAVNIVKEVVNVPQAVSFKGINDLYLTTTAWGTIQPIYGNTEDCIVVDTSKRSLTLGFVTYYY